MDIYIAYSYILGMPEYMDDTEMEESVRVQKEEERRSKKEPTTEELLECPTNGCPGGPEVWKSHGVPGGEVWCVGCPVCRGWVSQYLIPEGSDLDPYITGADIWLSWRRGEH